eukprot:TRINITY_DN16733_c0_g3_i3.p1 TRINITY_DN16733_c0_g3~~TRINITY_DN16733_c0_g3_i3.p1  ORF type:complete len:168 (+),score=22.20 TRINITY_DN16733_c0_g3_i3:1274-1777(+)
MRKYFGIKFLGRKHSGIDDATTIATVIQRMIKLGHCFEDPIKIDPNYNPFLVMVRDFNMSFYNSHQESQIIGETLIIKIRGLPWTATKQQIIQFFSDVLFLSYPAIHITKDSSGRDSGEAYVELKHRDEVLLALKKHKNYLGSRWIEIFPSSLDEMSRSLVHGEFNL